MNHTTSFDSVKKKKRERVVGACLAEELGEGFGVGEEVEVGEAAAFGSDGLDGLDGAQRGE